MPRGVLIFIVIALSIGAFLVDFEERVVPKFKSEHLILDTRDYDDMSGDGSNVSSILGARIKQQPFNLVALILFACAIIHTFFTHYFTVLSKKLREKNREKGLKIPETFTVEILRFLGEVEVVFGIWVVPLMICLTLFYSWDIALEYAESRSYFEPMFVVVIMSLAGSKPIIAFAERDLKYLAELGGGTIQAWWWAILTFAPLTGSFITEPGAMTVAALLLARKFYHYKPSSRLSYGTLGLLFTNISVGGVLTSYAAPPVLMVSKVWDWDTNYMVTHFGWKAILGIVLSNTLYYFYFKKDFKEMEERRLQEKVKEEDEVYIPIWITCTHIAFLIWTVINVHHPVMFIGSFLLYLGFHEATQPYQKVLSLKGPVLVGFFLAGLVMHGGLQGWWIGPLLSSASQEIILTLSMFLTSFNDNAAITYLASLTPHFSESMKYMVMVGAISAGGLTVIANAPNPAGQSMLNVYFSEGVSATKLVQAAILPAIIMAGVFVLLQGVSL